MNPVFRRIASGIFRSQQLFTFSLCLMSVKDLCSQENPAAPPVPASGSARIETVSGLLECPLDQLRYLPKEKRLSAGQQAIPLADVLQIRCVPPPAEGNAGKSGEPKPPAGGLSVILRSGEEVHGLPGPGDESELVILTGSIHAGGTMAPPTSFKIALEQVHALIAPAQFPSEESLLAFQRSLHQNLPGKGSRRPIVLSPLGAPLPPSPAAEKPAKTAEEEAGSGKAAAQKDLLFTAEGSRLEGVFSRLGAGGLQFQAEGVGEVKLPLGKVRAVVLAELGSPAAAPAAAALEASLFFADGSAVQGELLSLEAGAIKARSAALGEIQAPLASVAVIEIQGGRCAYLSDLEPARAVRKLDLFNPRPVQRDANVLGGPLKIRGQTFRKGLGMLSHARLEYDLEGGYSRFQATLGMDDAAQPQSLEAESNQGGIALFKVYADDKLVLEKELSWKDPPLPVDLAVAGARSLALETDYGPGFLILDYADWAEARLIR